MNQWADLPVGTRVRCTNPDDFRAELARKLRNRIGTVERHQYGSGRPIIEFAKEGNRKAHTWVPSYRQWVEIVP